MTWLVYRFLVHISYWVFSSISSFQDMTSPFIFDSLNRDMENQIHEIKSVERANELIAHLEDGGIPRYIVEEFGYDAMVITTNPENPTKRQFITSTVLGILQRNGYKIDSVGIHENRPIVYLE